MENYATNGLCPLNWYCAQTTVGREKSLRDALIVLGIETYLPLIPAERKRNVSRFNPIKRAYDDRLERYDFSTAFFPGYLFARLDDSGWAATKTRLGVRIRPRWIEIGDERVTLSQEDIDFIATMAAAYGQSEAVIRRLYRQGDGVEILSGPFTGCKGLFSHDADERIMVLVSMLGRQPLIAFEQHEIQPLTY